MAATLERDSNGNPRFHGCSSIRDYDFMGKLGEGTFGEVYKARSKKSGSIVALKKILMHNEKDGFPITALREIKLLKMLSHINILKLEEMAVEKNRGEGRKKPSMYMVTPYMEHDLSGLLENPSVRFTEPQIKCYMLQLLEGLQYLHANNILHRDMKAANLLISNRGILQIADFGLARIYDDPPPKSGRGNGEATRDYTTLVVTRWYRPPELLLQLRRYTPAIDLWGAGCVFGEMFKGRPILAGNSDLNQALAIFDLVGSPTEENMPGWSSLPGCEGVKTFSPRSGNLSDVFRDQGPLAISLLTELLRLDWRKRINAQDALNHPYFHSQPYPARPGDIPTFEDSHELDRRKFRGQRAALPPAPAGGSVGMGPNGEWLDGRDGRGRHPRDRHGNNRQPPPPGVGPSRYDSRLPEGAGPRQGNDQGPGHRPAWARDAALPPRPPVSMQQQSQWGPPRNDSRRDGRDRDRGPPPSSRVPRGAGGGGGGAGAVDKYVPNYGPPPGGDPYRDRDRDHQRRRSRSPGGGGWSDRDRDRGMYRR